MTFPKPGPQPGGFRPGPQPGGFRPGPQPGGFRPGPPRPSVPPTGPATSPATGGPQAPAQVAVNLPSAVDEATGEIVRETGHPAVDAVLSSLENASRLAPSEQIAEYEAAHQVLQETLASIDR
ncbi:hypothetical protein [Paractinoplanes maris]|uniref:hypothetical protein n=1 Tax=Paractinoplanes maris TaxID=1734446 RepID=UPI0020218EF4|nr:hypothetical protein [Actinoplanes maris]